MVVKRREEEGGMKERLGLMGELESITVTYSTETTDVGYSAYKTKIPVVLVVVVVVVVVYLDILPALISLPSIAMPSDDPHTQDRQSHIHTHNYLL